MEGWLDILAAHYAIFKKLQTQQKLPLPFHAVHEYFENIKDRKWLNHDFRDGAIFILHYFAYATGYATS